MAATSGTSSVIEVVVRHRHERVVDADHPADPPRPQARRVDDVLRCDGAELRLHAPFPARKASKGQHPVVLDHLGPSLLRRAGVGVGRPVRIEIPLVRVEERALQARRIDDRDHRGRFGGRDQVGVRPHRAQPGQLGLQPPPPLRRARQLQAAGHLQTDALPALRLDLRVEADRVLLERRDIGVAVDGMETTRRVPRRPRREFLALDQRDVRQAAQRQVIRDAATDDAATDDDDPVVALHAAIRCDVRTRA